MPAMIEQAASNTRPSVVSPVASLDPANGIRAGKAAEIANRIYQCNAAGGGGAGEKAGQEGPERSAATSRCCFFGLLGCSDGIYFSVRRMLAEWP
jgi:hypothetical protein